MEIEKYQCKVVAFGYNSEETDIEISEIEEEDGFRLVTVIDGKEYASKGEAYFVTFQGLRDQLLKDGYGLKCNGARINAVQSNMMGGCPKVYLVELGRQALMKDVVLIWDYADIDTFPDTMEQNEYFKRWNESFRQ